MSPHTKASRITSGFREIQTKPDASLPPHMQHLRRKVRSRAERPGRAKVGARVNGTVALLRSIQQSDWKQPGRRYGPAPKGPGPRHQVAPMDTRRRCLTYAENSIRALPTDRQVRQIQRMAKRLGEDVEAIVEQLAREIP